jgi:UDP-N-acetylmuramoyl-tripeptide--D-alanyl-D-alanine ligase
MGMNHLNEITYLSNIAKPHLAIITNVGPAHIEFFKDEQEIAVAKSEIFSGLVEGGKVLLNADNAHFEFLKKQVSAYKISDKNIFSFGENSQTNYQILKIDLISPNLSKITVRNDAKQNYHYEIGSINRGAINNSIIVFALLDLIGKDVQKGLDQLKNFTTSEGRGKILEIEIENKKITIIDDTYNASLLSIKMGIENCQDFKNLLNKKRLLCAIGDMRELGSKSQNIHQEILDFIDKKHFAKVFLVGQEMKIANDKLKISNSINFSDSTELAEKISNFLEDGDILYIKGSRGIKMEKIIEKLTNKTSVH